MKLKDKDTLEIDLNKDEVERAMKDLARAVKHFGNSDNEDMRRFVEEILGVSLKALIAVYAQMCVADGSGKIIDKRRIHVEEGLLC